MTTSPESTRPATRRALRERTRAQAESSSRGPLPAFGDSLRPDVLGVADDTETTVQPPDTAFPARDADTVAVDVVEPARGSDSDLGSDAPVPSDPSSPLDVGSASDARDEPEPDFLSDLDEDATRELSLSGLRAAPLPPVDEQPVEEQPIEEQPIDSVPGFEQAAWEPTEFEQTVWEPTDGGQTGSEQDGFEQLEFGQADDDAELEQLAPETAWADGKRPPTALTWIDAATLSPASVPEREKAPDLFTGARLVPGWLRPRVIVPLGIVAAVCGAYVATTLMWPLNAVEPVAKTSKVEIAPAPVAAVTWPGTGSAAVGAQGMAPMASTTERDEIASISKVVSVLMVLDELPLEVGEQGPSFEFDYGDANDYWGYRSSNQSALDVPVGGSLTEYQMLQGILLGSANNYIDRLAVELWGSEWGFAQASETWLRDRGLSDITVESPSGFDEDNIASPASLLQLGELAMKNPVFAEIVGTRSAEIPGVGTVTNTNKMLDDPGVVGIKTGTLSHWNLLTAKDVPVGDTTVRLYASVLGQDDDKARLAVTRQLFAEVEKSLAEQPVAVPKGTVVGHVSTEWGDPIDVVTDADTQVILWNGATATAATDLTLGDKTESGAKVGTLTAEGPIGSAETSVSLAGEIEPPSIWWRLTHPLELFGLDNS